MWRKKVSLKESIDYLINEKYNKICNEKMKHQK